MKTLRPLWVALPLALVATPELSAQQKKNLTLEQALGGKPRVQYYSGPQRIEWARDDVHYEIEKDGSKVWVHPETGATKAPDDHEEKDKAEREENERAFGRRSSAREKQLHELLGDERPKRIATMSPDEEWASFVREDNNLSVVRVADKAEWVVTEDGDENHMNGILDWVYQEEVYGRGNFRGHWWSGDSKKVAFLRLDESEVKTFTVIDHVAKGGLDVERAVLPEITKYPKAGDPNPKIALAVAWPETKKVVDIDLSSYDPDVLIVRVGWTPDHGKVLFMVQDRIQTWMDLNTADPATGAITRVLREESESWVERPRFPQWLDDGTFLWLSERTGYKHIYHHQADGTEIAILTAGEWQVRRIIRVAELDGRQWIWFTGTADGAIDDHLYRVGVDGQDMKRLTQGMGRHSVSLNHDGSYFLDRVSMVDVVPEVRICRGDGEGYEVLDRAESKDEKEYVFRPTRRLVIKASDGYQLDATLLRPPKFDMSKTYPIFLPTYSGPDAPSVRNSFRPSLWEQFLAQQGALVLKVNVRSASGRGHEHTSMAYKRLGVTELRDLEDAVDYICEHHNGDPNRVAIYGWSYGGTMAAYALTHSDKFCLGISGAGVHDWRLYDTIYTERYMSTPQLNPEGYSETSVIEAAGNLRGHLVLLHGVMDDNVHVQNTMHLVYALQQAGKDNFEMMLYPKSRHGVRGTHHRRLMWRALKDKLGLGMDGD